MNGDASLPDAIPFLFPGLGNVHCLFSTARAGDMSLAGKATPRAEAVWNRTRFMERAGFGSWAEIHQVHGDAIVPAAGLPDATEDDLVAADGQFTRDENIGLIIKTADCQPLLFARRDGGAVAALHVGWRGNAMDFPGTAVARLCREFACGPADLLAVRGPSLGPTASEFVNFAKEWPGEFASWHEAGSKTVNLWALTRHQLEAAGLRPGNIFALDLCTHTMRGWFFSHRRKDAGRQISAIWMQS